MKNKDEPKEPSLISSATSTTFDSSSPGYRTPPPHPKKVFRAEFLMLQPAGILGYRNSRKRWREYEGRSVFQGQLLQHQQQQQQQQQQQEQQARGFLHPQNLSGPLWRPYEDPSARGAEGFSFLGSLLQRSRKDRGRQACSEKGCGKGKLDAAMKRY